MTCKIEFISITSAQELSAEIRTGLVKQGEVNELAAQGIHPQVNLAARINEEQVGLLCLAFPYPANANICWLGVLPEYQHQGVATSLMQATYCYAKQQQARTITVATVSPDKANKHLKTYQFYENQGFQPLLHGNSSDYKSKIIYMVKQLNNPLQDLMLLEKDARLFGFDWPDYGMIISQIMSECEEIREAITEREPEERIQEEIGDLLHSTLSLCLFSGFDPEQTLLKVIEKFAVRMQALKTIAKEKGLATLKDQSIESLISLWSEAKKHTLTP